MSKPLKPHEVEPYWVLQAERVLVGRSIVSVRYMTTEEMAELGWYQRALVIQLDDDNIIYASQDDEGNGPGALFTNNPKIPTLPVLGA